MTSSRTAATATGRRVRVSVEIAPCTSASAMACIPASPSARAFSPRARMAGRIEYRIHRHRRLVVEQHDQLVADPHEGQFLARHIAEIEFGIAVEMNRDGLTVLRLFQLEVFRRCTRLR